MIDERKSQSSHNRENLTNFIRFSKESRLVSHKLIWDCYMRARPPRYRRDSLGDLLSHRLIETPGNRPVLAVPDYGSYL